MTFPLYGIPDNIISHGLADVLSDCLDPCHGCAFAQLLAQYCRTV